MLGAVTKEQVNQRAQHLDLIYSQEGTLYNIIPHAPRTSNEKPHPIPEPHVDGIVGSLSSSSINQLAGQLSQMTPSKKPILTNPKTNSTATPATTSKVNTVQSMPSKILNNTE